MVINQQSLHCPNCNGRLFDVVNYLPTDSVAESNYAIMIKCWKCHRIIKIISKNLVQAPHKKLE